MNRSIFAAFFAAVSMMLALANPTPVSAAQSQPLTFCNQTSVVVGVAVGYFTPGVKDPEDRSVLTGPFVSRGWKFVDPGICAALENPFGARYIFWYGFSKGYNDSEIPIIFMRNPALPYHFCVTNYFIGEAKVPPFTYEDENVSVDACDRTGGHATESQNLGNTRWVTPLKVDTWVNATVNFTGK